MISLASVVLVSMLVAPAPASPDLAPGAATPATLTFDALDGVLVGISYGIDAVDSHRSLFGERHSARLAAGNRVVAYSCPGAVGGTQVIRFDFDAGRAYRLVCMPGGGAQIRPDDC